MVSYVSNRQFYIRDETKCRVALPSTSLKAPSPSTMEAQKHGDGVTDEQ